MSAWRWGVRALGVRDRLEASPRQRTAGANLREWRAGAGRVPGAQGLCHLRRIAEACQPSFSHVSSAHLKALARSAGWSEASIRASAARNARVLMSIVLKLNMRSKKPLPPLDQRFSSSSLQCSDFRRAFVCGCASIK